MTLADCTVRGEESQPIVTFGQWGGHYGMNAIVLPFRRPSESRVLRTAVREPSRTLLLGDSDTVYINSQFVEKGADAAHGTLAFRHRDRANVLYFDGHVEAVSRTQTADPEFRAELDERFRKRPFIVATACDLSAVALAKGEASANGKCRRSKL